MGLFCPLLKINSYWVIITRNSLQIKTKDGFLKLTHGTLDSFLLLQKTDISAEVNDKKKDHL